MARRPHPHVAIPSGAAPPTNPSPSSAWSAYLLPSSSHDPSTSSYYTDSGYGGYSSSQLSPLAPRISLDAPSRPTSRPSSYVEQDANRIRFPEPQLYRSSSQRASLRPGPPSLAHRATRSELTVSPIHRSSRPPSFVSTSSTSSPEFTPTELSEELSGLTLASEEGLRRFQAGELPENDQEWYKLVPPEARESIMFEIIKSERDYVNDLLLVKEVFVEPLVNTSPVPQHRLQGFVKEVFYNLDEIHDQHQRMLGSLFQKQREFHPLIDSVAEIVMNLLHQQCMQDPRVRKRDLITFLSRPVTRLPRDAPIILEILKTFVKSTQPGIAAAEDKVKFWELARACPTRRARSWCVLIGVAGLDLYDEKRTLVYSGPLGRRWIDLHVALLDNYLLLLKPESRPGGVTKRSVVSRVSTPTLVPRTKGAAEDGSLFHFRSNYRDVWPFTIYHAYEKSRRRYTLFANSETVRERWRQQESNMWFAPHTVHERFFRYSESLVPQITAVAPMISGGKSLLVVGCASGVYAALRNEFGISQLSNATSMVALPEFNKLLILSDHYLYAYSLDLISRAAAGQSTTEHLESTRQVIAGHDGGVLFFEVLSLIRWIVLYASKRILQVFFNAIEVVRSDEAPFPPRRNTQSGAPSNYRPFGEVFDPLEMMSSCPIPKDSHDFTALHTRIGVCHERGITIVDPTNPGASSVNPAVIPKFGGADSSAPLYALKSRCQDAKPLGLVRCLNEEILVVYDDVGCYIDKHGVPCRSAGYLRWEAKATAFAHRGDHILLFSPEFVEVRTVQTGKLVQVIETPDVRLAYQGMLPTDPTVLVACRGRSERGVVTDKIVELVETSEITTPRATSAVTPGVWDEWDM
ncbi:CNH domain-containing protein [Fomitopsis serialis]|uniref:CNH domain-containing protein n=1 Tax=Fomitopsis serialis TaxID=139415 RepID=UPI0020074F13|nr:CNH domain-containing protein [Neoantrodia serialis]KAH9917832.1 CNH domain-containing protein [Neoantrodia serialis]